MSLETYWKKRDFAKTREPRGKASKSQRASALSFVVQEHHARRLHYDFRLELDGVLLSWAVPKEPSEQPNVKRLAVQTEDHPLEYGKFSGTIAPGQYGAGEVKIWDHGVWIPESDPHEQLRAGKLSFELRGERLRGNWHLVRTHMGKSEKSNWLLFHAKQDAAEDQRKSVKSVSATGQRSVAAKRSATSESEEADASDAPKKPFPKEPKPQLATLISSAPEGDDWIHEIKFDGYRLLACVQHGKVRLLSRNGKDFTERAPSVAAELGALQLDTAIFDGELVALRESGVSDFQLLQNAFRERDSTALVYYLFDAPYLDGRDLRELPLVRRKALLKQALGARGEKNGLVRYSEHTVGRGPACFEKACELGLEGIISKRQDSPYQERRSQDWLKVRCHKRQEFVIGGFTAPGGSRSHFGALLVGVKDDDGFRYSGKVGTGFTEKTLKELHQKLSPLLRKRPTLSDVPPTIARAAQWVAPKLVAEIEFTEWTQDHRLRHPVFRGLREDKAAEQVRVERPRKLSARETKAAEPDSDSELDTDEADDDAPESQTRPSLSSKLTHPERVLYAKPGLTKRDLALYYESVAERILPHLIDRPLTLVRCPNGQNSACFFQKHASAGLDLAVRVVEIEEKSATADYMTIDDVRGLIALVQLGALELHTWGCRTADVERPDVLVFDLDPDPELPWSAVAECARELRSRLKRLGLKSLLKTTGGKGVHLVLPITPGPDWDVVRGFAETVAHNFAAEHPDTVVATMTKAKRRHKIFVDYFRNTRGATFVVPYSTRRSETASVATPIAWTELAEVRPDQFNVQNLQERLTQKDPWAGYDQLRQELPVTDS